MAKGLKIQFFSFHILNILKGSLSNSMESLEMKYLEMYIVGSKVKHLYSCMSWELHQYK